MASSHPTITTTATIMAQVGSSQYRHHASGMSMKYEPLKLPNYLSNAFNVEPIFGVPTDDELKATPAVIQAVETTSHSREISSSTILVDIDE